MQIIFAAVGYELWDAFINGTEGRERNILFSFYDIHTGGFKQRKKSWENLTGKEYHRPVTENQESKSD